MSGPTASPAPRLFIALWPDEAVQRAIAQWQAGWQWPPGAALVRAERLHLTLHFLGNVAPQRLGELGEVLRRVPAQGFTLRLGHGELWPRGIAVMRPANSPTALRALHARIGLALASIGLPVEERPWRPHVTLARKAQGAAFPGEAAIDWESRGEFALVRTVGGGRGYEVLESFRA